MDSVLSWGCHHVFFLIRHEFYPVYAGLLSGVFGVLPLAEDASELSAELIDSGIL